MSTEYRPVSDVILHRRSVRNFAPDPVPPLIVRELVTLACAAPAPHHLRPWRFVHVASADGRERLADAMGEAWLQDLVSVNRPVVEIDRLIARSRDQIMNAPALLVAGFTLDGVQPWADEARRRAERDMFVQSLGAALQNILLAAFERGIVGYLKGAPLFCADAVRDALDLPADWHPAFLVLLGFPTVGGRPQERAPARIEDFLIER